MPNSAWADGNSAEAAGQLGKKVEHPNQSQPNPGPRADGTPCTYPESLLEPPVVRDVLALRHPTVDVEVDLLHGVVRVLEAIV